MQEQTLRVLIDNSSVFTPGASQPQFGFRRGELIAQQDKTGNRTTFDAQLESGVTAFHFSVQQDPTARLNVTHEYQAVFIEPSDGTHIFDLQTGMMPLLCGLAGGVSQSLTRDRDTIQPDSVRCRFAHAQHPLTQHQRAVPDAVCR